MLANWCPHCVPLSDRNVRTLARRLRVPVQRLDIDRPAQLKVADRLVRFHGDRSPDYLIPQVFLEWSDGKVDHLFTGFSEEVARTRRAWHDFLTSDWLRRIEHGSG